jgi:tetratricopeptide (TPR) repeat protein
VAKAVSDILENTDLRSSLILFLMLLCAAPSGFAQKRGKTVKGIGYEQERKLTETFFEASKQKMLGNLDEAAVLFHECIKLDGTHAASYFELANLLYKKENLTDALPFARKARSLDPNNEWYNLFEADILINTGDAQNAIIIYQALIKRFPDKIEYNYEIANAYLMLNKVDEAIKIYDKMEEVMGVNEELSIQKEKLYLEQNKLKEAVAELEKLIAAFPGEQRYLGMLAEVYIANDMAEKAYPVYERMLENDANDPILHLNLAEYFKRKGDYERSFQELKFAFASPDLSIDQKIQVLVSYYTLTDSDKRLLPQAFELLDLTTKAHPKDAKGFAMTADFLYREKRLQESREAFYNTVKLDSSRFPVWSQLIQVSYEMADHKAMQRDSETALALFPNQGILYLFNGIALNGQKKYSEAASILSQGEMFVKSDTYLYVQLLSVLADAYNSQGKFAESDETFEKALKRDPVNALILNNYSYFLSLRKDKLDKAEEMSKRSNILRSGQPSYQDTYAWILYQQGNYTEALEWVDKALASGGSASGTIVEHRGDILFRLGRKDEAIAEWKKAKTLGEFSDELEKKLSSGQLVEN